MRVVSFFGGLVGLSLDSAFTLATAQLSPLSLSPSLPFPSHIRRRRWRLSDNARTNAPNGDGRRTKRGQERESGFYNFWAGRTRYNTFIYFAHYQPASLPNELPSYGLSLGKFTRNPVQVRARSLSRQLRRGRAVAVVQSRAAPELRTERNGEKGEEGKKEASERLGEQRAATSGDWGRQCVEASS